MRRAFTLIELLVVIAIIAILAALLLPVLSKAKGKAQGALCLNDGKQLMTAMTLYVSESNDLFPPNPDDGNKVPGHNWAGGNAGQGGADEFNPDVLKDPDRSLLISCLGGNVSLFRCPADKRQGPYDGPNAGSAGQIVPAARTDRKSTRLNSSHGYISYAVFCLKKKQCFAPYNLTKNRISCIFSTERYRRRCRSSRFF